MFIGTPPPTPEQRPPGLTFTVPSERGATVSPFFPRRTEGLEVKEFTRGDLVRRGGHPQCTGLPGHLTPWVTSGPSCPLLPTLDNQDSLQRKQAPSLPQGWAGAEPLPLADPIVVLRSPGCGSTGVFVETSFSPLSPQVREYALYGVHQGEEYPLQGSLVEADGRAKALPGSLMHSERLAQVHGLTDCLTPWALPTQALATILFRMARAAVPLQRGTGDSWGGVGVLPTVTSTSKP